MHVLKDLHRHVLDAVRRMRREMARRGGRGRKRKPGLPRRGSRRRLTNKEKSAFIFKHRWLIVKRREGMSIQERADLETILGYLPELKTLRDFVDRLTMLFEGGQTEELARGRHAALLGHPRFQKVPELSSAMGMLPAEKFAKIIAFLRGPACRRVRTSNHVERVNRQLRHEEEARYKWRERRTIVRFLVLLMDRRYERERALRSRWHDDPGPIGDNGCSPKAVPRGQVA